MKVLVKMKNKKRQILHELLMKNHGITYLCCDLIQATAKDYKFAHALTLSGLELGSRHSRDQEFEACKDEKLSCKNNVKEQESNKLGFILEQEYSVDDDKNLEFKNSGFCCESEEISSSISSIVKPLQELGWPLGIVQCPVVFDQSTESEAENQSTCQDIGSVEIPSEVEISCVEGHMIVKSESRKLQKKLELSSDFKLSNYIWFSYQELKEVTCQFSSGNLIGEGGSSNVYKGCLPSGQSVAVKLLKSYKEAWNDFSLEVDIVFSLSHKHITPLIGVCVEDDYLFLVYDFLPRGSLDEHLHGGTEESVLPWKVRFKVAVGIAQALNYLHNECCTPVIHRDVKASNILLSNAFDPQLSDFGLAIWGSTDSSNTIHSDVVGTFGYIAPEYFMHGMVSDKLDVYSFGVVLFELLSGRKPICSKSGEKSLVKWAKGLLEEENLKALLDPKLDIGKDEVEMHRMAEAANLCTSQSPRLRPKMSQILKLLRGEVDGNQLQTCMDVSNSGESYYWVEDEISRPQLDFSFLERRDQGASPEKQNPRLKLKDFLKEPLD